jgi:hypothetical protein
MNFETEGRDNENYTQNTENSYDMIAKLSQLPPIDAFTNKPFSQKMLKRGASDAWIDFRSVKNGQKRSSFPRKSRTNE